MLNFLFAQRLSEPNRRFFFPSLNQQLISQELKRLKLTVSNLVCSIQKGLDYGTRSILMRFSAARHH